VAEMAARAQIWRRRQIWPLLLGGGRFGPLLVDGGGSGPLLVGSGGCSPLLLPGGRYGPFLLGGSGSGPFLLGYRGSTDSASRCGSGGGGSRMAATWLGLMSGPYGLVLGSAIVFYLF
jgi:hypothetical protein